MVIGILINLDKQGNLPNWQCQLIEEISDKNEVILINEISTGHSVKRRRLNNLLWKVYRFLSVSINPSNYEFEEYRNLKINDISIVNVTNVSENVKFSDIVELGTSIEVIDSYIRLGWGILTERTLKVLNKPVLSLHGGDMCLFRGAPQAFWEMLLGHKSAIINVQILSPVLDAGKIMVKEEVPLKDSWSLNRRELILTGARLMVDFVNGNISQVHQRQAHQEFVMFRYNSNPGFWDSCNFFWLRISKALITTITRILYKERWAVVISQNGKFDKTSTILYSQNEHRADPFVLEIDGKIKIVYEKMTSLRQDRCGEIWEYDIASKSEQCLLSRSGIHFSYPYPINLDGCLYLIPETSNTKRIKVYKYESGIQEYCEFELPIDYKSFADPVLIAFNNRLYLILALERFSKRDLTSTLYCFETADLKSPEWRLIPVEGEFNSGNSRNAGGVLSNVTSDKFSLPAQDCSRSYGSGLVQREFSFERGVLKLLKTTNVLMGDGRKINGVNVHGVHHFSKYEKIKSFDILIRSSRFV